MKTLCICQESTPDISIEINGRIAEKSKTGKGLSYSLNQEEYLKVFLENGNVPLDNNAAERAIRNFCIGRKNWVFIDTIRGAQSSAMIYSIAETAKANYLNGLNPFRYLEFLLTEMMEHEEDTDYCFIDDLLPWSDSIPDMCKMKNKKEH